MTRLGYLFFTALSNSFKSIVIKFLSVQILVFSDRFGLCVMSYTHLIVKGFLSVNLVNVIILIAQFI